MEILLMLAGGLTALIGGAQLLVRGAGKLALGFGLIGIFVGPVVLAVTYTLFEAWIEDALGKEETA